MTSPKSRKRILIPRAPGNELDFNTGTFSLVLYVLLYGFNTMDSIIVLYKSLKNKLEMDNFRVNWETKRSFKRKMNNEYGKDCQSPPRYK